MLLNRGQFSFNGVKIKCIFLYEIKYLILIVNLVGYFKKGCFFVLSIKVIQISQNIL